MNDELQKQLAELLQSLMAFGADAKQFAADQIPPLVQEKIMLGRVEETAQFVFGLLSFVAFALLLRAVSAESKAARDAPMEEEFPHLFRAIVGGVASVVCLVSAILNTFAEFHALITVWFAPRIYIVEWLQGMVTK